MRFVQEHSIRIFHEGTKSYTVYNTVEYPAVVIYEDYGGRLQIDTVAVQSRSTYYGEIVYICFETEYNSELQCSHVSSEIVHAIIVPLFDGREMAEEFVQEMEL